MAPSGFGDIKAPRFGWSVGRHGSIRPKWDKKTWVRSPFFGLVKWNSTFETFQRAADPNLYVSCLKQEGKTMLFRSDALRSRKTSTFFSFQTDSQHLPTQQKRRFFTTSRDVSVALTR